MAEYISREDYCEENCGKENREGYKTCKNCGMLNISTADVQPIRRGRWEYYKNNGIIDTYICTNCQGKVEMTIDVEPSSFKYCPNCGADMRGDAD